MCSSCYQIVNNTTLGIAKRALHLMHSGEVKLLRVIYCILCAKMFDYEWTVQVEVVTQDVAQYNQSQKDKKNPQHISNETYLIVTRWNSEAG